MKYIALILIYIGFCLTAENVTAAEMEAGARSAGLINDALRKDFPAASAWDIGGQFRIRAEAKDAGSFSSRDFVRNLDHKNDYFLFRTKLHLGWTPKKWVAAYVEGRDSRLVSDSRTISENDRFDLYQAYVRLGDPVESTFSLKAGRQELIYGDQRYIGNGDWSNTGRSFDSVKIHYQNSGFWLDAFTGRPVLVREDRFNNANHHDWFSGIYGSTRRIVSWQDTDIFFLARNTGVRSLAVGGTGPRDIYTLGTRFKSLADKLHCWDYGFEAAGQFGSIVQDGNRLDHRAYAVNITAGHRWKSTFGAPRVGLGYDYGSGDGNPSDNRNGTFEMLFGTNHRFYGNMDLMGLRNMHIPRIEGSFRPAKNVTVSAEWLGFWLADTADLLYPETGGGRNQNGYGRNRGFDSHVGHEVDLLVDWKPVTWGQLRSGYGRFLNGEYIRRSVGSIAANGGSVDANWFFVQFSADF